MKAKLQRVIGGANQFVLPLFQRKYSWDSKEWNTLWEDLLELFEEESGRNHDPSRYRSTTTFSMDRRTICSTKVLFLGSITSGFRSKKPRSCEAKERGQRRCHRRL
jgi:uncharacterized protein with ParB-like and HNH nuclease domain